MTEPDSNRAALDTALEQLTREFERDARIVSESFPELAGAVKGLVEAWESAVERARIEGETP